MLLKLLRNNAPNWRSVNTFPDHFHDGHSKNVVASTIKDIRSLKQKAL